MEIRLPPSRYTPSDEGVLPRRGRRASGASRRGLGRGGRQPGRDRVTRGGTGFHRLGTPEGADERAADAVIRVVTPGYFRTLRIPVLGGREFTEADDANPTPGFVVNEAFARAYLSDIDPLRARLSVWMEEKNPHLPVLGVVGNVSEGSVRDKAQPTVFYSHRQMAETGMTLFVADESARGAHQPVARRCTASIPTSPSARFERSKARSPRASRASVSARWCPGVRGQRSAACLPRALRAARVRGRRAHEGDRHPHRARRAVGTRRSVVAGGLGLVAIGGALASSARCCSWLLGTQLFGVTSYDVSIYASVFTLLFAVAAWRRTCRPAGRRGSSR